MKKFEITYHLTGNIKVERIVSAESLDDLRRDYISDSMQIRFKDEDGQYHQFHGRNLILTTIAELKA
mgnify:CR=1 FL=1